MDFKSNRSKNAGLFQRFFINHQVVRFLRIEMRRQNQKVVKGTVNSFEV